MLSKDVESGKPKQLSHFEQVFNEAGITPEVRAWSYSGSGTEDDPFVVDYIENDPRNPQLYTTFTKWLITLLVAFITLAVAFSSSAFSGGAGEVIRQFGIGREVFTLGISLFVLGFAIGPLLWAPLSEIYGRRIVFIITYGCFVAFNAGAAGSQNAWTLLILRFFAGAVGSAPLTNSGAVIADIFSARERGLAMALFASAPSMGPVLGPIVGGFVGMTVGWRWIEGVMAIFTGILWIAGILFVPETYTPIILRKRAAALSKETGMVYKSRKDFEQEPQTLLQVLSVALSRPWVLLFVEPIVLLLSVYMAIVYGTLYMCFSAFPIVYQEERGWNQGVGGLAFLGVAVGMIFAILYSIRENARYAKVSDKHQGFAPPESRLPPTMVGGICLPIGLFWFAWTNGPEIHWIVSIIATAPFGFGMILNFLGIMNYLVDSYTIYAASVLAANSVMRSVFGAVFPLFTTQMFGVHWASTVPASLALVCVPMPFLFYRYGAQIRKHCKYAAESTAFMKKMAQQSHLPSTPLNEENEDKSEEPSIPPSRDDGLKASDAEKEAQEP